MSGVWRGERWEVAYGLEATPGTPVTSLPYIFGIFEKATMADPEIEYLPFWGITDGGNRTYTQAYKGKWTMAASIGDIMLLNGAPLQLPLGAYDDSGTASPYTHTATGAVTLPSITMFATFYDAGGSTALQRRWTGGKVNKASYSAEEGGQLRMSIDEILFLDLEHSATAATAVKYNASMTSPTITIPTTEPYYFSMGSISIAGTTFCRIKSFKLDVNNNAEAKYYICNPSGVSGNVPTEIIEGKREYGFTCTVDVADDTLYGELLKEGTYSGSFTGFDVVLTFTRGASDTIVFTMPPTTSATGAHAQGCLMKKGNLDITGDPIVPQELDILVRDMKIVVTDAVANYD